MHNKAIKAWYKLGLVNDSLSPKQILRHNIGLNVAINMPKYSF